MIKTYVRLGVGVGIVANMALDPVEDADLAVLEAGHLFPSHVTWVGFDRSALLRKHQYDFISLLAPHLTRRVVDRARGHLQPGGNRCAVRRRGPAAALKQGRARAYTEPHPAWRMPT